MKSVWHSAIAIVAVVLLASCAGVKPFERGILAKPEMNPDADPGELKLLQHTFVSKEAASGGHGAGGGGCGCN